MRSLSTKVLLLTQTKHFNKLEIYSIKKKYFVLNNFPKSGKPVVFSTVYFTVGKGGISTQQQRSPPKSKWWHRSIIISHTSNADSKQQSVPPTSPGVVHVNRNGSLLHCVIALYSYSRFFKLVINLGEHLLSPDWWLGTPGLLNAI